MNWVVPSEVSEPKKSKNEKAGKNEHPINQALFRGQVHENGGDETGLEGGDEKRHSHIRFHRAKVHIRESDSDGGESEQGGSHHQISANVPPDFVGIFLSFVIDGRNIRRVIHRLQEVEKRKHEDPNQINEVPEKTRDLHTIGEVFGILPINPETGRKQHVTKNENAAENVCAMQASDGKISCKICAVFRQKHVGILHITLFDRGNF